MCKKAKFCPSQSFNRWSMWPMWQVFHKVNYGPTLWPTKGYTGIWQVCGFCMFFLFFFGGGSCKLHNNEAANSFNMFNKLDLNFRVVKFSFCSCSSLYCFLIDEGVCSIHRSCSLSLRQQIWANSPEKNIFYVQLGDNFTITKSPKSRFQKYLLICRLDNVWSNSKLPNIWYVLWQFLTYPQKTHSNPFKPVRACSSPTLGTCERNRSYPYPFKTRSKAVRFFTRFPPLQLYEFKSGGKALLGKYPYCCVNTRATP